MEGANNSNLAAFEEVEFGDSRRLPGSWKVHLDLNTFARLTVPGVFAREKVTGFGARQVIAGYIDTLPCEFLRRSEQLVHGHTQWLLGCARLSEKADDRTDDDGNAVHTPNDLKLSHGRRERAWL